MMLPLMSFAASYFSSLFDWKEREEKRREEKIQPCANGSLQLLGNLHLLWQVLIMVRLKSSSTSVSVLVGGSTVRSQIITDYVFRDVMKTPTQ